MTKTDKEFFTVCLTDPELIEWVRDSYERYCSTMKRYNPYMKCSKNLFYTQLLNKAYQIEKIA